VDHDELSTPGTGERLLATAASLFRRRGYAGAGTRELAGLLGIRSASLYHHMGSKEDLLHRLSVEALVHIHEQVTRAVAEPAAPPERLRALIRAHVVTALADQDEHAVMLMELRALSGERRAEVLALRDRYESLVRQVIADAQDCGALRRDIAPKHLALGLLNLLNWSIFWYQPGRDLSVEGLAELFATTFLEGALPRAERTRQPAQPEPKGRTA